MNNSKNLIKYQSPSTSTLSPSYNKISVSSNINKNKGKNLHVQKVVHMTPVTITSPPIKISNNRESLNFSTQTINRQRASMGIQNQNELRKSSEIKLVKGDFERENTLKANSNLNNYNEKTIVASRSVYNINNDHSRLTMCNMSLVSNDSKMSKEFSQISTKSVFSDQTISVSRPFKNLNEQTISNQNSNSKLNNLKFSSEILKENNGKLEKLDKNDFTQDDSVSTNSISDKNEGNIILDDFLILEEKMIFILNSLKNNKNVSNLCYEWWNYSNYCELKERLEVLHRDESKKGNIFRDASILEIISLIIIYEISFDSNSAQYYKALYLLLNHVYQNFLLLCETYTSKFLSGNIFIHKIHNIVLEKLNLNMKIGEGKSIIRKNNGYIFDSLKKIFEIYGKEDITDSLAEFLIELPTVQIPKIHNFFKEKIVKKFEKSNTIPIDNREEKTINIKNNIQIPFITSRPKKPYTILLDLDETLINLRFEKNIDKGIITLRPGLFDFLDEMVKYYELVIFTCGTSKYADPIIDLIESKKRYFEHRLYREHNISVNGEYIKDLNNVGRDLSKTLIVDNIPQNFRIHKENGIFIKSFYSDDFEDRALYELLQILKKIAEATPIDIRKEVAKYKNEIVKYVSTSIARKIISAKN